MFRSAITPSFADESGFSSHRQDGEGRGVDDEGRPVGGRLDEALVVERVEVEVGSRVSVSKPGTGCRQNSAVVVNVA